MSVIHKLKRAVRGEVRPGTVALELLRRSSAPIRRWNERATLERSRNQAARLTPRFARMAPDELVAHFQYRSKPHFLPGLTLPLPQVAAQQQDNFPLQTKELIAAARHIVDDHSWPLLGLGEKCFGVEIEWRRDPLSGFDWPLEYHRNVQLTRADGSDVRVLWELNRLAHLETLALAYAVTNDESFSAEFFKQTQGWCAQNPVGSGPNWSCAMEVALRAMNLVAAFEIFRRSPSLEAQSVAQVLGTLDQHGSYIRRNLEFSYIATSNHYLSDVVGLLWLGIMLPELLDAEHWRVFALREMLREMDKQVLGDGADFEASTGYHRFVVELFLYSFVLCRANGIEIDERHWEKLHQMLEYVRAYLRPDGFAPLIGDTDSGRVLPIFHRRADDHAYVLAIGAVVFDDPLLKLSGAAMPQELLWVLGEQGVGAFEQMTPAETAKGSRAFPEAGTYILRDDDLYLLFNASGAGINGRGSHGHNDAMSIEVSACGIAFIVDPGTYVYTADLRERHLFRSTAYHSTVEVDSVEQNTIDERVPFIIGNEAEPHVISWESGPETDVVIAEHIGYQRLARSVTHRRTVRFEKSQRFWVVEDELRGKGEHVFSFRFHFAPGLEVKVLPDGILEVCDKMSGARLLILAGGLGVQAELEGRFSSSDYGAKAQSVSACWTVQASMPLKAQFVLVPLGSNDDESVAWDWLNMSAASVASESHSTSNQQINLSKLELDFSPGESDC